MIDRRVARIAVAALALVSLTAAAETLDEAWAAALANDGRLAAAQARERAADAALAAARAEHYPSVSVSTATSRWRDTPAFDFSAAGLPGTLPLFSGDSVNLANAQVSLPLYSGGAIGANVDAATAVLNSQGRATESLRQDLKLAVAEAYVGVLSAQSALEVARANTASLAAHAREVEDMRRAGQVPANDYLAAAVSLADATQRELQAANALEIATGVYNRRVGRPLDTRVALAPLDEPLGALGATTLPELVGAAQEARAELAGLTAAAEALAARAAATRAARRPQLAVNGGYAYLENDFLNREDYWFVMLGVKWNLFDSGQTRHAIASFERQSEAARAERTDLAVAIELDVRRAWTELTTARSRVDVTATAVQQAEENLRVARDRYRNGEGTNTEVLDAEALRALSASNFDTARYDVRLAEMRLARAVGAL
jgi:outer membrane protein TolC